MRRKRQAGARSCRALEAMASSLVPILPVMGRHWRLLSRVSMCACRWGWGGEVV